MLFLQFGIMKQQQVPASHASSTPASACFADMLPTRMLLQFVTQGPGYVGRGSPMFRPYHVTLEDLYGSLLQYYGQTWLSMRADTWPYMVNPDGPGSRSTCPTLPWTWRNLYDADTHPLH
jgi:hypothetical protein